MCSLYAYGTKAEIFLENLSVVTIGRKIKMPHWLNYQNNVFVFFSSTLGPQQRSLSRPRYVMQVYKLIRIEQTSR